MPHHLSMEAKYSVRILSCFLIFLLSCIYFLLLPFSCKKDDSDSVRVLGGFQVGVLATGILAPTSMAFAPDGRLFVCEQRGNVRIVKNGELLAAPFLTIPVIASKEWGLLGIAFDPSFAANGHVYLYYTDPVTVHNRVVRYTASGDPDAADPNSAQEILDIGPGN